MTSAILPHDIIREIAARIALTDDTEGWRDFVALTSTCRDMRALLYAADYTAKYRVVLKCAITVETTLFAAKIHSYVLAQTKFKWYKNKDIHPKYIVCSSPDNTREGCAYLYKRTGLRTLADKCFSVSISKCWSCDKYVCRNKYGSPEFLPSYSGCLSCTPGAMYFCEKCGVIPITSHCAAYDEGIFLDECKLCWKAK